MPTPPSDLHVHAIPDTDLDAVAELLGRGMADNPMHLAVYRRDEASRASLHGRLMRTRLRTAPWLQLEGVNLGQALAGVTAWASPGTCRSTLTARLQLMGRAVTFGPRTASRLLAWKRGWDDHDPDVPHVHLGPVSVDRHLRGRGIGTLMLTRHVDRLDVAGAEGYLETDRPEAVGFYARFGYAVVDEADVVGTPCWFMRRRPA